MISIDLSDEEASLFLKFREHQDMFAVLDSAGVFNVRNGQAVLNFDADGTLSDIECKVKLYKRGINVIPLLIKIA